MIIVSQDKTIIINFEHISGITISEDGHIGVTDNWGLDTFADIGTYKTEERAKEVLQDIITAHSDFEYYKNTSEKERKEINQAMIMRYEHFDSYEMPKE